MTKLSFFFILSFLYACGNNQQTAFLKKVEESQVELIHEKGKGYPNQTQLSIGFITHGKVDFLGIKKENAHTLSVNNQSNLFEIGSITKVFTSTILAQFVLDKRLKVNDDISQHLEIPLKNHAQISFLQLANHTSGLPRLPTNLDLSSSPDNPYKDFDEEKLREYLSGQLTLSEKEYEYSNLGFGLLGYVLTQIENKNYETILQESIFSKFSMGNSTTDHKNTKGLLIKGLDEMGNETPNWTLSSLVGAGGILSSTEDLTKFMLAHFDDTNKELALTRKKTLSINHISDVGLGWEIINRKSGDIWYKHNGGTGGYTSVMIMDVKNKNGIVILSNISAYSSQSATIDELGYELMKSIKQL